MSTKKIECFETVLIFSDKLTEKEYEENVKFYKRYFADLPATKIKTEKMGKKKLAYAVKDCEYGYYAHFIYESTEDLIHIKLDSMLRKDDDVIKFITIRYDRDYTPDEDEKAPASDKSEQKKKPVDVFNLIFGLEN